MLLVEPATPVVANTYVQASPGVGTVSPTTLPVEYLTPMKIVPPLPALNVTVTVPVVEFWLTVACSELQLESNALLPAPTTKMLLVLGVGEPVFDCVIVKV